MQITRTALAAITTLCLLLAACGGGGGGGGGDNGNNGSSSGGSSSSSSSSSGSSSSSSSSGGTASNVLPIQVTDGPTGNYVNGLFATVTVCQPGTNNCQSIDNILVDTGSYGLRLMASTLTLALPQQSINESPLLECALFMSGYTWGSVQIADIKMSGEQASAVPIQIIGDPNYTAVPSDCNNTGKALNSVAAFGVNGVLGIGPQQADCPACTNRAISAAYYTCSSPDSCTSIAVPAALQVQNPVFLFQTNNNGAIISLPAISSSGALDTKGNLIFGIGTQSNNGLKNAKVITTDNNGYFTTTYKISTLTKSFLDSGSNGLFFNDAIATCLGWYCPTTTQNLSATHISQTNVSNTVRFSIANSSALFQTPNNAFNNLGGTSGSMNSFDWGLPFYFGRTVYTAYSGKNTPAGAGPYIAY